MEEIVLLLLFICVSCFSQAVVHHLGHHAANFPCEIQRPLETSLVKAYFGRPVPVSGCTSEVRTNSSAEIHVLLYHGKSKSRIVELTLHNHQNNEPSPPFLIYLSSDSDITWRVHMKGDPVVGKHKFEINRGSRLKFVKKQIKAGPFVTHRKASALPSERIALLTQVSRNHQGIVTSYSELAGGSIIALTIGKASSTDLNKSCAHIDWQQQSNLTVSAVDQIPRSVEGCLVNRRDARPNLYNGMRKAFVIELKDIPSDGHFEVNLELKRQSRRVVDEDFWLVLKSPNVISWRVYTKRLKGSINIAANSYVDMSDIRMEPVAIRSEELKDSGMELLRWVEHYLGPVTMYTAINDSNLIQITLPEVVPEIAEPSKPKEIEQPVGQIKYTLKRSIRTQCDANSLLVAVSKNILQALNIKSSAVSLIDPQCKALENETHVYILTSSNGCGTNYMEGQHGRMTYVNVLVIHSTNTIAETNNRLSDSEDLLEEEGSGFEIYSGSGELENSDLVLDDEDLKLKPLQLSFTCSFKSQQTHSMVPVFELGLFHSEDYLSPYARYPVDISNPHARLYLQASIISKFLLKARIEHCWLSHDTDSNSPRHAIVTNGCKVDDSVKWHSVISKAGFQSERLSFTLENYVMQGTDQRVFVMCEMSVCCLEGFGFCHSSDYPACEPRTPDCNPREHRLADPPHRLVIIGPISLPQQETKYKDIVTDGTLIGLNPSPSDAAKGTMDDKQDHVVIEGLDSGTVVGIAFAAFIIGVLMMGALWFIHTHSGSIFTSGPFKRGQGSRGSAEHEGETTPGSSAPISA